MWQLLRREVLTRTEKAIRQSDRQVAASRRRIYLASDDVEARFDAVLETLTSHRDGEQPGTA
jgi:hypothetical protein